MARTGYDVGDLRARSAARVKSDPEFRYLLQDIEKMDERIASQQAFAQQGRAAERTGGRQKTD